MWYQFVNKNVCEIHLLPNQISKVAYFGVWIRHCKGNPQTKALWLVLVMCTLRSPFIYIHHWRQSFNLYYLYLLINQSTSKNIALLCLSMPCSLYTQGIDVMAQHVLYSVEYHTLYSYQLPFIHTAINLRSSKNPQPHVDQDRRLSAYFSCFSDAT